MLKRALRLGLAASAAAATGWLIWSCAQPRLAAAAQAFAPAPAAPNSRWTLDDVVATAVAVVAVGGYVVLMTTAAVAVCSELLAPRRATRLAAHGWTGPSWWRAAVLAACGIGVVVQASSAQAAAPAAGAACVAACAPSLDGLPYPDLPTPPHLPTARPTPLAVDVGGARPDDGAAGVEVVVRAGDSLWSIAADLSPPHSDNAQLAAFVARLYSVNRPTIGENPDLIYPGTVLRVPGGAS
jgi:hypothetical protein